MDLADDRSTPDSPSASGPGSARRARTLARAALAAFVVAVFAASFTAKAFVSRDPAPTGPGRGAPSRIVSLAPSITETLFALSLGDRVVGVTRYCDHPPEARTRAKVGGYYDPSYEAIVALQADLTILLPQHEEPQKRLAALGIETLTVGNTSTAAILDAIAAVGRRCDAEAEAREIGSGLRARLARVSERTRGLERPRVLLSVGRAMGSGSLKDVYFAGGMTLYDEAISLAGGENACRGGGAKYPKLTGESVLVLDPDVIVDLVADLEASGLSEDAVLADWRSIPGARAVETGRVHVLSKAYAVRPGPRFILLVEDLARILHPEADWGGAVRRSGGGIRQHLTTETQRHRERMAAAYPKRFHGMVGRSRCALPAGHVTPLLPTSRSIAAGSGLPNVGLRLLRARVRARVPSHLEVTEGGSWYDFVSVAVLRACVPPWLRYAVDGEPDGPADWGRP
ncbi:MAG: ABC transporter substrate-binding protein [Planctomycetota bacterium]